MNRSIEVIVGRLNAVRLEWCKVDMVVLLTQTRLVGGTILLLLEWTRVNFGAWLSIRDMTYVKTITRPRMAFLDVRSTGAIASVCHDQVVEGLED